MKVILAMVMSLDGKTTKGNQTKLHGWTSSEDQAHFSKLIAKHHLIVMGSNTFAVVASQMHHAPGKLRVVLTRSPRSYDRFVISEQLEFTKQSPRVLLRLLEARGYKEALLVGGAETNSAFLEAGCVDEVWVTVEPSMFGKGKGLVAEGLLDIDLQLASVKRLNKKGTLLLRYRVQKGV